MHDPKIPPAILPVTPGPNVPMPMPPAPPPTGPAPNHGYPMPQAPYSPPAWPPSRGS